MSVKIEMKCDYAGYCYTPEIEPETEQQDGWFQITKDEGTENLSSVTIERLRKNTKVDMSAKHACPSHGPKMASDLISALKIFSPNAVAKEKELRAEVPLEDSI